MASWATRTPAIRDILSVSIAEMGGVLFGLSIGSMSGILCSAWLVKRFGTRNVILVTMSCALIGMMILSLALWLTSPLLFAVGLGVFGASFGSAEVAINVEGAAVEREMNKTVLPMMHGFYSLGTLAGAGVGMALTAFGVPATVHILLAALVGIAPIYIAIQAIPDGTGKNAASLGFPLTISAASDTGPDAPTRVSVVATTGYLAFLVGPPLLGYLGEHYGLRSAMLVVLALVILAAIVAKAVAKPDTKTQTAMENS